LLRLIYQTTGEISTSDICTSEITSGENYALPNAVSHVGINKDSAVGKSV
jgi:hypothetical protein